MNLALFSLVFVYFLFGHKHVLNHFGLTNRDNKLMWIGCLVPTLLSTIIQFIAGLIIGHFLWVPLVLIVVLSFVIYYYFSTL